MLSGTTFNPVTYNLANFYKSNGSKLSQAMTKVASGNKIQRPQDNIGDFFRADKIKRENRINHQFLRDITEASSVLDSADKAGHMVFQNISRMKEIVNQYWDGNSSTMDKAVLEGEFEAIKSSVGRYISSSSYDGKQLIQDTGTSSLASVSLNAYDLSQSLDIQFDSGDVANVSGITLSGPDEATVDTAVQAELNKAVSYMAKVSVYSGAMDSHYTMIEQKITTNESYRDLITNADEGAALTEVLDRNIRQQMTSAMMAQANMAQGMVASFFLKS